MTIKPGGDDEQLAVRLPNTSGFEGTKMPAKSPADVALGVREALAQNSSRINELFKLSESRFIAAKFGISASVKVSEALDERGNPVILKLSFCRRNGRWGLFLEEVVELGLDSQHEFTAIDRVSRDVLVDAARFLAPLWDELLKAANQTNEQCAKAVDHLQAFIKSTEGIVPDPDEELPNFDKGDNEIPF